MAFYDRLKEARVNSGFTQEQLAERLGVAKSTISGYESGNREPTVATIAKAIDILGIDANFLYQDEMDALGGNPMQLKYTEMEHIKKYRSLDDHGKETIDYLLDRETSRVTALSELERRQNTIIEFQGQHDTSYLAEYFHSASAGDGVFILGNEATAKISISETDWDPRVDYVIKVSGDSMEPDFVDGDNVMISQRVEMQHGDVGIFIVNGKAYIKEYGKTELISRNPDANNIKIAEYDNIVCMGKVIGKLHDPYEVIED